MRRKKHQNIYNYYRGPNIIKKDNSDFDYQIEDNTTKALINTLEYSSPSVVKALLAKLNLKTSQKEAQYTLQPILLKSNSRPDALISYSNNRFFIESKVSAHLDIVQIENHLKGLERENNRLIVITPRISDKNLISQYENVHFITWNEIWKIFQNIELKDDVTKFLISQFTNYLEENNMTEFNGWKQDDFDAFLFIENDSDRLNRLNVKKRFDNFMTALHTSLLKVENFSNTNKVVMNSINRDTDAIWGNIIQQGFKNINIAHFWITINSSGIKFGINNEGVNSTRPFIKRLKASPYNFTEICSKLDNYTAALYERYEIKIRDWGWKKQFEIELGQNFKEFDTQYLIDKISQLDKIDINFSRTINRDDKILESPDFINFCVDEFKKLEDLYKFNNHKLKL